MSKIATYYVNLVMCQFYYSVVSVYLFQILQLHPGLAPFKVSVIASGSKGRELGEIATYISRELRASGIKLLDTRDATDTLEKNLIRLVFVCVYFITLNLPIYVHFTRY